MQFKYTINHKFVIFAKSMAEAVKRYAEHHPHVIVNNVLVEELKGQ